MSVIPIVGTINTAKRGGSNEDVALSGLSDALLVAGVIAKLAKASKGVIKGLAIAEVTYDASLSGYRGYQAFTSEDGVCGVQLGEAMLRIAIALLRARELKEGMESKPKSCKSKNPLEARKNKKASEPINPRAKELTREEILVELESGTAVSRKVAKLIRTGKVNIVFANEAVFNKVYVRLGGVRGDQNNLFGFYDDMDRIIYLKTGVNHDLASCAVHEGVHALQHFGELPVGTTRQELEKYAYFAERLFQNATGRTPNFSTFKEMIKHVEEVSTEPFHGFAPLP